MVINRAQNPDDLAKKANPYKRSRTQARTGKGNLKLQVGVSQTKVAA